MENVYIVGAKRTPVGRFQGSLQSVPATKLGAEAIKAALQQSGIEGQNVDEIIFGQVLTSGVGQAPARQAALGAGLPLSVRATTVGKVCGSGLKTVMLAAQAIMTGDSQVVVAGGMENMSLAPHLIPNARAGYRLGNGQLVDSMMNDGLTDAYSGLAMGNCAELCAKEFEFTREEQDAFSQESYVRAREAQEKGLFADELVTLEAKAGRKTITVTEDEEPKAFDLSKMGGMRPAFEKEGTITAGSSSKINDGAACIILASESAVKEHNLKPLAKIVSWAGHAQEPKWFTTAPVEAVKKNLKKSDLSVDDIDLFEINEAFAVVTMAAMKKLEIPREKVNVNGGAIAMGHPIGASGARILNTLIYALKQKQKKRGLATLCIGGGEAVSLIIETV